MHRQPSIPPRRTRVARIDPPLRGFLGRPPGRRTFLVRERAGRLLLGLASSAAMTECREGHDRDRDREHDGERH